MKFDWDRGNQAKCSRRAPIAEIETALSDARTIVVGDPYEGERRIRAVGRNAAGRGVFVVFTPRMIDGETHPRPISARYIHEGKSK